MKMEAFKAVCPLELGDTVAIPKAQAAGAPKVAYYLPERCCMMISGVIGLHTITDIMTMHYLKSGGVSFMYELDGSGKYEALTVKVPVAQFNEALKNREKK